MKLLHILLLACMLLLASNIGVSAKTINKRDTPVDAAKKVQGILTKRDTDSQVHKFFTQLVSESRSDPINDAFFGHTTERRTNQSTNTTTGTDSPTVALNKTVGRVIADS
ncbi:hypothetical protein PRIPAC_81867 [Pristionchus pacificus]|uniref:Uncharacterized protein n=1 Tax=Pristionchus pacificus TaxID=54126 RepID=A0A2A6BWK8_PRIPA|nr:hypothetical protein PRIPAC_81867 [Pristionchus pacificus]|eukprot:PDM70279.1 hypothetical protein PRIPAC_46525 [Pristionchus pacificus]